MNAKSVAKVFLVLVVALLIFAAVLPGRPGSWQVLFMVIAFIAIQPVLCGSRAVRIAGALVMLAAILLAFLDHAQRSGSKKKFKRYDRVLERNCKRAP